MSRFLSSFRSLSPFKKSILAVGAVSFVILFPIALPVSAVVAFFSGLAISLAVLTNKDARERIGGLEIPGFRLDKKPLALAAAVFAYFVAISVAFAAIGSAAGKMLFSNHDKPQLAVERVGDPAPATTAEKKEETPQDARATVAPAPQLKGAFVGNKGSNMYHESSCYWAQRIKPRDRVWFSSAQEAQAQGYKPCKACEPPGSATCVQK